MNRLKMIYAQGWLKLNSAENSSPDKHHNVQVLKCVLFFFMLNQSSVKFEKTSIFIEQWTMKGWTGFFFENKKIDHLIENISST